MYLLYRHPLRGCKVNDINDPANDEKLSMGEKALFVEHPTDKSNRIKVDQCRPSDLPWADTQLLPYKKIVGPYLSKLFERAFIDSLHNPEKRPTADEWNLLLSRLQIFYNHAVTRPVHRSGMYLIIRHLQYVLSAQHHIKENCLS